MNKESATSLSIPIRSQQKSSSMAGIFGKSGYKIWVLTAILLLAFWSMFTGSVSLKWSSGNLTTFSYDSNFALHQDLDVLELEEREKIVKKMWDVYTHRTSVRLQRFWLQAFEAAYENLSSDVAGVRDNAISEIAKLSIRSLNLDSASTQSRSSSQGRKMNPKQADKKKEKESHNGNLQS